MMSGLVYTGSDFTGVTLIVSVDMPTWCEFSTTCQSQNTLCTGHKQKPRTIFTAKR